MNAPCSAIFAVTFLVLAVCCDIRSAICVEVLRCWESIGIRQRGHCGHKLFHNMFVTSGCHGSSSMDGRLFEVGAWPSPGGECQVHLTAEVSC